MHRLPSRVVLRWGVVVLIGMLLPGRGAPALAAGNGRVTGGGVRVIGGELAQLSVSAIRQKDGSVTGQFKQHDPDPSNQYVHGTVTCLEFIDSHTAIVSGVLTQVRNVAPDHEFIVEGAPFLIWVQDNGSSPGADLVSFFFVGDPGSPYPCGDQEFTAFVSQFLQDNPENVGVLTAGDLQVSQ